MVSTLTLENRKTSIPNSPTQANVAGFDLAFRRGSLSSCSSSGAGGAVLWCAGRTVIWCARGLELHFVVHPLVKEAFEKYNYAFDEA